MEAESESVSLAALFACPALFAPESDVTTRRFFRFRKVEKREGDDGAEGVESFIFPTDHLEDQKCVSYERSPLCALSKMYLVKARVAVSHTSFFTRLLI